MNKKKLLAVSLALVIISSCVEEEEPLFPAISVDEASGELLWKRITEDFSYRDYSYWPGHEDVRAGQAPHGALHRIYVNRTLLEGLPTSDRIAPDGSIIVKENLTATRELDSVTVMAKVNGYNPGAGDWFWAKYASDGTVQVEGKPDGCIRCHEGVDENDYVIVRRLDAPFKEMERR
jgi:hypothetical protein